jgi:hypothetical protein
MFVHGRQLLRNIVGPFVAGGARSMNMDNIAAIAVIVDPAPPPVAT